MMYYLPKRNTDYLTVGLFLKIQRTFTKSVGWRQGFQGCDKHILGKRILCLRSNPTTVAGTSWLLLGLDMIQEALQTVLHQMCVPALYSR